MNNKPMLNAYPDSLGGKLSDIAALLKKKEMQDTFSSFYILPACIIRIWTADFRSWTTI